MLVFSLASAALAGSLLDTVVARAGNPYAEPGLAFTFNVGQMARAHRWDIRGNKAEVRWTNKEGAVCTVVTPVPYAGDDELQKQAWAAFTNDQYWLLAPSKLKDPGVNVVEQGDDLVVTFDNVGLTPGDTYTFHIDRPTGDVTGWDFVLQGGNTGSFAWAPPTKVGNLHLSLERTTPERTIRFTDVRSEPITLGAPGGGCLPPAATPPSTPTPSAPPAPTSPSAPTPTPAPSSPSAPTPTPG